MTKHDIYREILRGVVRQGMSREQVLLVALVLHTHAIALRAHVEVEGLRPKPGRRGVVLAPLTTTHVTELLASLWPSDDERGRAAYWFFLYRESVAYESFDELLERLRERASAARDAVLAHESVDGLLAE